MRITYILAAHNASKVLQPSVDKIQKFADENSLEIAVVIVENGSSDETFAVATALSQNATIDVEVVISEVGLGNALRTGLQACGDGIVVCTASDLPFGFSDLLEAIAQIRSEPSIDACFGSKGHPESQIRRSRKRLFASRVFSLVRWAATGLRMGDSQGSMILISNQARDALAATSNTGFLVTTETALNCKRRELRYIEVPVKLDDRQASSTVRLFRQSVLMTFGLFKLRKS